MTNSSHSSSDNLLSALLRRLRPPEGQTLVWWLIEMQRVWWRQMLAFAAFLLSFHFLFGWSWSLSLAMIISMFLHECGHAAVFRLAKIRFIILFLFPLGAVAAPVDKQEDERSDRLHWNTLAWLLQAGPAVNVALMLIFLGVPLALPEARSFSRDMVYVNGLLASMNLIPLWTLDAGQLFNLLYSSLQEREEPWLTGILLGSAAAIILAAVGLPGAASWALLLANTLRHFGWVVFLIVFAAGVLNKQGRDNPLHAFSSQAMRRRQAVLHLGIYALLVGLTLWVFAGPLR